MLLLESQTGISRRVLRCKCMLPAPPPPPLLRRTRTGLGPVWALGRCDASEAGVGGWRHVCAPSASVPLSPRAPFPFRIPGCAVPRVARAPRACAAASACHPPHTHTRAQVLVDDLFPCTDLSMLAYTKAARRQLWVPLIEKAAAKLFRCYEALTGGTMSEALHLLTGYPTTQILLFMDRWPPFLPSHLPSSG